MGLPSEGKTTTQVVTSRAKRDGLLLALALLTERAPTLAIEMDWQDAIARAAGSPELPLEERLMAYAEKLLGLVKSELDAEGLATLERLLTKMRQARREAQVLNAS